MNCSLKIAVMMLGFVAALSAGSPSVAHEVPLPKGQVLLAHLPGDWRWALMDIGQPGMPPSWAFFPGNRGRGKLVLSMDRGQYDEAALREKVRQDGLLLLVRAKEKSLLLERLAEGGLRAFAYTLTDPNPGPGAFPKLWQGMVRLEGGMVFRFTLFFFEESESWVDEAQTMIRVLSLKGAGRKN